MKKVYLGRSRNGFTLIELLVVIFIIGLLASIVVVNVNIARLKSRDARRIADIETVRTAIELYNDNTNAYPVQTATCTSALYSSSLAGLVSNNLLPVLPLDPRNGATYFYCYKSTALGADYKVWATQMESSTGGTRASSDGGNKNALCTTTYIGCSYELFSAGGQAL